VSIVRSIRESEGSHSTATDAMATFLISVRSSPLPFSPPRGHSFNDRRRGSAMSLTWR
jgi:hypothetical protein